jgi:hypothetical protein
MRLMAPPLWLDRSGKQAGDRQTGVGGACAAVANQPRRDHRGHQLASMASRQHESRMPAASITMPRAVASAM